MIIQCIFGQELAIYIPLNAPEDIYHIILHIFLPLFKLLSEFETNFTQISSEHKNNTLESGSSPYITVRCT